MFFVVYPNIKRFIGIMHTRESILVYLKSTMSELFEVAQDDVVLEARLYEDLDIDSIDAVDLIVKLKELTDKKIQPYKFRNVRTVGDVVEAVYELANEQEEKKQESVDS